MIKTSTKILIVEDDYQIRSLYKQILSSMGYEIIEANDGEQAIIIYNALKEKPDIVILDYQMPKINGLELTQEILEKDPSSNILMISGDPKIDHKTVEGFGIRYKMKPVRMEDILIEISSFAQT